MSTEAKKGISKDAEIRDVAIAAKRDQMSSAMALELIVVKPTYVTVCLPPLGKKGNRPAFITLLTPSIHLPICQTR